MTAYVWYNSQINNFINGTASINFGTETFKLGLMKTGFGGLDQTFWSDIAASQCTGTNYPADGFPLTTTIDASTPSKKIFFANFVVGQSDTGFPDASFAIIYATTTGRIMASLDFGTDMGNVLGDFNINFDQTAGALAIG